MSEDLIDRPRAGDDDQSVDVTEIMRFAEMYPAIPLPAVIREVIHAQHAVAQDAEDRGGLVARIVATRLAGQAGA